MTGILDNILYKVWRGYKSINDEYLKLYNVMLFLCFL